MEIKDSFNINKYVVIKQFLDRNMANFMYEYVKNKALYATYMQTNFPEDYKDTSHGVGHFADEQCFGAYSCYGDMMFDTLLVSATGKMNEYTGLELNPQYSYFRLYEKESVLKKHKDRESCEISTTLCLGYNSHYNWPLYIDGKSIELEPGDMVIYKGCDVEHWREPFEGLNHAQVFLHYNDKNGKYKHQILDGRNMIGLRSGNK